MTTDLSIAYPFSDLSRYPNPFEITQTPEIALQTFQRLDKYARWRDDIGRRETWGETVTRAMEYLKELSENRLPDTTYNQLFEAILSMRVMPSMRLMAMAGDAARRDNTTIYNCAYLPVADLEAFKEALLISMAGCGVGFSVENQYVNQLLKVKPQNGYTFTISIEDSAEGWGEALYDAIQYWISGDDVVFDFSQLRPAGAILKTKGGRSSGPKPFAEALQAIRTIILNAGGRHLKPIEAHDIMCWIGSAAVSGGVRRTAMLSLFDRDDEEMLNAKVGEFWVNNPQRQNANNSAVYHNPSINLHGEDGVGAIMDKMNSSGTGEPGIFNRIVAYNNVPKRRYDAQWKQFGTNPCGEIILRPYQFCNLSSAVARPDDDVTTLIEKVRLATILGTIQSMATHFPSLRPAWHENCSDERLLGVDITGWMDCKAVRNPAVLQTLQRAAVETNKEIAEQLGIESSVAVTCNKPSGNTSTLVNCSSGIHPRWAPYYIRRVRLDAHNALYKVLKKAGVPMQPEIGQGAYTDPCGEEQFDASSVRTWVAEFPIKSPDGAICRGDMTAISQLENWLMARKYWTEHQPSCTITYSPDELGYIELWLKDHWDIIGGLTFYPRYEGKLLLAPYEEITKKEYLDRCAKFPTIDWNMLTQYEEEDYTTSSRELACAGDACELV